MHAYIEENREMYKQLFYQLLSCDTVNPPGNEEKMAKLITECLAKKGAETELQYVEPGRPNAIADVYKRQASNCPLSTEMIPPRTISAI